MFRNYFKTAFRYMGRNKLFTGLNILGLGTGLACGILIFLWVQDEVSYDRFNPGADRIFRLTAHVKDIESAAVPTALAAAIQREMPVIRRATRINPVEKIITIGTRKFDEKVSYYVDSNFLRIFDYPLLRGDRQTVLLAPRNVVLTEATAIKYFGGVEQAMGKSIFIDNDSITLQVAGVLKNIPANSHLQFSMLLPIENWDRQMDPSQIWRYFNNYVYFQLADGVRSDPAAIQTLGKQITTMRNGVIVNTQAVAASINIQPLTDIHLQSHYRNDVDGQGNIQYVRIFILIAVFVIFIACINFMNLATAMSATRSKEVGLRKTIGALRSQLILQFIGESMLLSFISLILALLLVYAVLPSFNTLASKSILLDLLDIKLMGKVIAITVVVGLLAGSYPAFYISSFNAIKALKGGESKYGKDFFLRNGLIVLQFSLSVILMISTVVIYHQLQYLHNRDIGFNREDLLYVPLPQVGDINRNTDALRSALRSFPQTGDYTITSDLPTNLSTAKPLTWRGMENGSLVLCQRLDADEHYLKTFGMKMLAGRFYSEDYKGSDSEYVVNETTVRLMRLDPVAAIGKLISLSGHDGAIIGVVKDFNFKPVHQPIEPLVMRRRNYSGGILVIRAAAGTMQRTLALVQGCFQKVYGSVPFSYGFVDQDLDRLYIAETRMGTLLNIFSVLFLIISCLGLFGLATFETQRRTKEIGIRKVLGAGEAGIVVLLAKEFLRLVGLSLLIAFPIAWYVMHEWLQGFVYKAQLNGWVFAAAGMLALLVAFVTVSYQTIRAAIANPVEALRGE